MPTLYADRYEDLPELPKGAQITGSVVVTNQTMNKRTGAVSSYNAFPIENSAIQLSLGAISFEGAVEKAGRDIEVLADATGEWLITGYLEPKYVQDNNSPKVDGKQPWGVINSVTVFTATPSNAAETAKPITEVGVVNSRSTGPLGADGKVLEIGRYASGNTGATTATGATVMFRTRRKAQPEAEAA